MKSARVSLSNISEVKLNVIPVERTYDSEGDLAVHPDVAGRYVEAEYDKAPKSKAERDEMGLIGGWNGMNTSFPSLREYQTDSGVIVVGDIAPTRYLIGKAVKGAISTKFFGYAGMEGVSPDMANVSLVAPVKYGGNFYLLAQIKGDALGSGEVHTGLVAGGVQPKHLSFENPLVSALQTECSEELGMDLSDLSPSSAAFMIDERFQGMVNFAYVASNADINEVLDAYENEVKGKEKPEVAGLALVPMEETRLIPLEGDEGRFQLRDLVCFIPGEAGLERHVQTKTIRPYTAATTRFLNKDPEAMKLLLEKAGF